MTTMRVWAIAVLIAGCSPLCAAQSPGWSLQLESIGLTRFDRDPVAAWTREQGVVFLTADRLLVYQVSRTRETTLRERAASGGGGNFLLNIKVLNEEDGHVIKTVQLVTNAAMTQVLATRDGQFVVRSGYKITLYSANFEPMASRALVLHKTTDVEDWQVKVSPSGALIVLLHEQVFLPAETLADGTLLHDGKASVEVEILDASTLGLRKSFVLAHTLSFWSPADDFLVSSNPAHSYSDRQVGVMDFEGKWSATHVDSRNRSCGLLANAMDRKLIVVHGCQAFTVLSVYGDRVFSGNDGRFVFAAAKANGRYLALRCDRYTTGLSPTSHTSAITIEADRIQVYDVELHKQVLSFRVHGQGICYAISSSGDLVVADGPTLSLARAGN